MNAADSAHAEPGVARARPGGISRRAAAFAVISCLLLALALRTFALSALLPCQVDPDATVIPSQVELIRSGAKQRDASVAWRMYPHLVAELAALLPEPVRHGTTLEAHLEHAAAPFARVRLVVALLSLIGVPATYWLARRFLARGPALLATFLSATSLLTLLFAQQARPHAPAAAFALLAVVAALLVARRPGFASCTLAGVAVGLAAGTLQSGVLTIFPVAAAWWLRDRGPSREPARRLARWLTPLWMLLLAAVIGWTLFPHGELGGLVLTHGPGDPRVAQGAGHDVRLDHFTGGGFAVIAGTLLSLETVTFVAALVALGFGVRAILVRRADTAVLRRDTLVAAAYVVPYVLVFGLFDATCERFVLQLVPFVACLAAAAWSRFASRTSRPVAALCLAALALPSLAADVALERVRVRASGPSQLAAWIEENVAPDTERVLCVPGVDVPLARTQEALDADNGASFSSAWVAYQRLHAKDPWDCARYALSSAPMLRARDFSPALADPLATVHASQASLVALVSPSRERAQDFAVQLAAAFQRALAGSSTRVCKAPADARDPARHPTLDYNIKVDGTIWTWELLSGHPSFGTTMELYRLP
ncbi:MAG TPA: phospholipid carrier-dependent glycosyltransferase [Planctomycetota bacterium]|nr:phospholipid carrier-dependent glycosyltransferase [Planctomycetota bacterium]